MGFRFDDAEVNEDRYAGRDEPKKCPECGRDYENRVLVDNYADATRQHVCVAGRYAYIH